MFKERAEALAKELINYNLDGYTITALIDNGKSAAVFEATDVEGNKCALKIFDAELIEKTGHEIQERRITQELGLKGHSISGLVKIIGGGKHSYKMGVLHYMVMEYIEGKNLKKFIATETYDEKFIKSVLNSLLNITEGLIAKGIAHRDIKPENIMVTKEGNIILMDLGVLKLIGKPNTENETTQKQFLATLNYSPPELLFGEEKDEVGGWRAINFYQIGGVLHDLITKKELFSDKSPYSNVVKAVQDEMPNITSSTLSNNLLALTRKLLIKEPEMRLSLTSIHDIQTYVKDEQELDVLEAELMKNKGFTDTHKTKITQIERLQKSNEEKIELRVKYGNELKKMITDIIQELKEQQKVINEYKIGKGFLFISDREFAKDYAMTNLPVKVLKNLSLGFPKNFYFSIGIKINETKLCFVELTAFYASTFLMEDIEQYEWMIHQILNPNLSIPKPGGFIIPARNAYEQPNTVFKTINLVKGVFSNDESFKKDLKVKLIKLINKAVEIGKPETEKELQESENLQKGIRNQGGVTFMSSTSGRGSLFTSID